MQILRTYPRFPESETLRVRPSNLCFMKLPGAAAAHSGLLYYDPPLWEVKNDGPETTSRLPYLLPHNAHPSSLLHQAGFLGLCVDKLGRKGEMQKDKMCTRRRFFSGSLWVRRHGTAEFWEAEKFEESDRMEKCSYYLLAPWPLYPWYLIKCGVRRLILKTRRKKGDLKMSCFKGC